MTPHAPLPVIGTPHRPPSSEGRILFFTCIAHSLTHVYMSIHTPLLIHMGASFDLGVAELTAYITIANVLFGLGALPAGWLAERWGEKTLLVAFFVLTAGGGALVGLAGGKLALAAGMTVLGLGTSIFHPVGNSLLAKGIERPGRAMGTNGLWGSLGQAIGPTLGAGIGVYLSWRAAYLVLAPLMLGLGLWLAATRIETVPRDPKHGTPHISPLLLILLLAMTCAGFNYYLITTMLPTHIQAQTGFLPGEGRGGYLTGLIYLIGGLGQYLAGRAVHHREGRGVYILVFLLGAPLVYLTGREWLRDEPLLMVAAVMSIFMFASQPIENVLLSRFSPERWRSTFFGLKFTMAFGIGGAGTYLSGWAHSRHGTPGVFTAGACFLSGALVLAVVAWRWKRPLAARGAGSPAPAVSVVGG